MFVLIVLSNDICTKILYQLRASVAESHFSSFLFSILSVRIRLYIIVCTGQSAEDNHIHRRNQQQSSHSNGLDSDEEHQSSTMFQANYQYTPLKEYAATRTGTTTTTNTNGIIETSISNGYRSNHRR